MKNAGASVLLSSSIWLNNTSGFCNRFAVICPESAQYEISARPHFAFTMLSYWHLHATINYETFWSLDKCAFCTLGAVCTSAYVRVLLGSPSQVPGRCSWCGCWALEQGSQWQFQVEESINSLPLSQSISSFQISEGFLLHKKEVKLCISIYPFIFHPVEDYK